MIPYRENSRPRSDAPSGGSSGPAEWHRWARKEMAVRHGAQGGMVRALTFAERTGELEHASGTSETLSAIKGELGVQGAADGGHARRVTGERSHIHPQRDAHLTRAGHRIY